MANQGTQVAEYIVKIYNMCSILYVRKVQFDVYMCEGSE